jgi:hypothetical protein
VNAVRAGSLDAGSLVGSVFGSVFGIERVLPWIPGGVAAVWLRCGCGVAAVWDSGLSGPEVDFDPLVGLVELFTGGEVDHGVG